MTELDALLAAHEQAVTRFATSLRTVTADTEIPHLDWNVGELGAHVLDGVRAYRRAALDDEDVWSSLDDGAAENARHLERTVEREPSVIADCLASDVELLLETWRSTDRPVRWSAGISLPVAVVAGIQLADVLVHGWDLSQASGVRSRIPDDHAVLAIRSVAAVAPYFVAPAAAGFTGVFETRLRGDGSLTWSFDDGELSVDSVTAGRVDCRIYADPATFLLMSYGRVPVWRAVAFGRVIAAGRKPWLGMRFKTLLVNP